MKDTYKIDGHGYYWKAELIGGPFDGLIDKVIQMKGSEPPKHLFRIASNLPPEKSLLGIKIIEQWSKKDIPSDTCVVVYKFDHDDEVEDDTIVKYSYCETTTIGSYNKKYD